MKCRYIASYVMCRVYFVYCINNLNLDVSDILYRSLAIKCQVQRMKIKEDPNQSPGIFERSHISSLDVGLELSFSIY